MDMWNISRERESIFSAFLHNILQCCACFGPKGGRQNYCGSNCTAINGGTVTTKAFAWFWVRNRMPERLWERCMEFVVKNPAGKLEKHFIDPRTGTAHKVGILLRVTMILLD